MAGTVTGERHKALAGEGPARRRGLGNTVGQTEPCSHLGSSAKSACYLGPAALPPSLGFLIRKLRGGS